MIIEILDSVECAVSKEDGQLLKDCLSFEAVYWKQGPRGKVRKTYKKDVFSSKVKNRWMFYTGLLPRVLQWCKEKGIKVTVIGEEIQLEKQTEPSLKGITFRKDQIEFIQTAIKKQRGLLVAPTQTGKTIIFMGLISCYPKCNILILSHTTTIIQQTYERLLKHGFKNVEIFGGGNKIRKPKKRITVSTIQSFSKLNPLDYTDYYDLVIVDEVQRVSKQGSQYEKVLSKLLAPLRFGFTATPKEDDIEAKFMWEGLLGKIAARLTIEEATDKKILKKPKLEIINSEMPSRIATIYKYQDTYEKKRKNGKLINGKRIEKGAYTAGISENKLRNQQIIDLTEKYVKNKGLVFIFVTHTEHGILLQKGIENKLNIKVPFVQGATSEVERADVKGKLQNKKIKVCIASNAWMEGLTIKTLTNLILAGGGRSELQLLQKVGRVLANNNVTITDFNDSKNKHLALHTTERFSVYIDKGWL